MTVMPRTYAGRTLTLGLDAASPDGRRVLLEPAEVARHKHVMGLTGSGKSMLLASLFVQLLNQGIAVALIDPHSDLVLDILAILDATGYFDQPDAFERLWYVDFSRTDRALPFNILNQPYEDHAVAQQLVEIWKRAWPSLEGGTAPQLENNLLAAALVLIQNRLPLTELARLLSDQAYRNTLLGQVHDASIIDFFHARFDRLGKGATYASESTLRRAFLLTFTPALRNSLGQRENALDLRALMDRGTSLLVNLGGLDAETQRLLGCCLTVGFEVAALSRVNLPAEQRRPYQLILDEFSMFSAQSEEALSRVLDLARKYGLTLTLAHQTWSQVNQRLRGALQNALPIAFRLGHDDAAWAAPRFLEIDPYLVKEVPDPAGRNPPRPVFVSAQEQQQALMRTLTRLAPREALIRIGPESTRLRTVLMPLDAGARTRLAPILDQYARQLLAPLAGPANSVPAATPAPPEVAVCDPVRVADDPPGPVVAGEDVSVEELNFLRLVVASPSLTVSQLYDAYGASVWKGNKLRVALEERGFLVCLETRMGKGSRPAKFLIPTSLAMRHVPTTLPPGRGGPLHRHMQQLVLAEGQAKGYRGTIEYALSNGGIVDVHLEREGETIAVEIAISSVASRELVHIQDCLDAGYQRVVALVWSDATRLALERNLLESFTGSECGRVTVAPLHRVGNVL